MGQGAGAARPGDGHKTMKVATLTRFKAVCRRVGIPDETAEGAFTDLVRHYAEEIRAYHNLSHIDRMLSSLDNSRVRSNAVELAIWYHDAIYEPTRKDNETESARFFADRLGGFVRQDLADEVGCLILATDPKRPRSGIGDEDLIIDIDLSILGSSPAEYENYRSAIRREYAFVPDAAFAAGRKAILQGILSQRIYATEVFGPLEAQARLNIGKELDALESTGG